jgi:nitrogen fixation protein FixH
MQMDRYYSNSFSYLGAVIDATTASICKNRSPAEGAKKFDITLASVSAQDFTIQAAPAAGESCGSAIQINAIAGKTVELRP